MKYEVNPAAYRQVFAVPLDLVKEHIKLAGALQLKVLLWILANGGVCEDIRALADAMGASASDVQDALQYWIHNQFLFPAGGAPAAAAADVEDGTPQPPVKTAAKPLTRTQKPNRAEVAKRGAESPEVSWLLCEAQNKFNRTLSFAETSTLLWLMDTYGLSPALIVMIIEYAASVDKCNIHFIETMAVRWVKEEIDTVDKAEQHLTKLEQTNRDWRRVCRVFGMEKRNPSKQEEIYVTRWIREWRFTDAMLKAAYDRCVNNTNKISLAYINKVLQEWNKAGYKKPEEIQEKPADTKGLSSIERASAGEKSYDIDEIEKYILND